MQFDIITIFPHIFDSYFNESILKRAQDKNLVKIQIHNLRDFTHDKHKTVDDSPYGGGPGMVLKVEPIYKAIQFLKPDKNTKTILLSAKGKIFNQEKALYFSKLKRIILICGRYEGVDERVTKFIDEEISIGEYVLSGGEIGALAIIEATSRLVPGVLGKEESLQTESHFKKGYLEYPQYTRPEEFQKMKVPKVLLSGNHEEIEKWRKSQSGN
jgi:tRNA (guanine37-N1)-methyltransferase